MRRLDKAFAAFFRRVRAGERSGISPLQGPGPLRLDRVPRLRRRHQAHRRRAPRAARRDDPGQTAPRRSRGRSRPSPSSARPGVVRCLLLRSRGRRDRAQPNPPVGIDVGLESFLTTSDGEREPNPRYQKTALPELRRAQRSLARKRKGGKNRRKSQRKVAKIHARVQALRREHHHQVALKLVRRYGLVAVESLHIQGMLKNDRLARSISDAGWSGFLETLRIKAESAGVAFVEVDARGTSQQCSACGAEVRKGLSVRRHDCAHCGLSLHRDENAARNILARGLQARIGPAGRNVGQ